MAEPTDEPRPEGCGSGAASSRGQTVSQRPSLRQREGGVRLAVKREPFRARDGRFVEGAPHPSLDPGGVLRHQPEKDRGLAIVTIEQDFVEPIRRTAAQPRQRRGGGQPPLVGPGVVQAGSQERLEERLAHRSKLLDPAGQEQGVFLVE